MHLTSQGNQLVGENEKLSARFSKVLTQSKLTSLYVKNVTTPAGASYNNLLHSESKDSGPCHFVEKTNVVLSKSSGASEVSLVEDEERPRNITLKSKRRHVEFTSPVCGNGKSPSSNDEAHVEGSASGFVTARKKLVCLFFMYTVKCDKLLPTSLPTPKILLSASLLF